MKRDCRGVAAVMFAVVLLPVMLAIGAAVDYASMMRMRTALTTSLDSAALSVAIAQASSSGNSSSNAQLTHAVEKALAGALGPLGISNNFTASARIDSSGALVASAHLDMPTRLMRLVGIANMNMDATTRVAMPGGPIELAMALDTTDSMAGAKMDALKAAATNLNNILFSGSNAASNVKVSVVPFSNYVNISTADRNATWLTGSQDYTTPAANVPCETLPDMVCTGGTTTNSYSCLKDGMPSTCTDTTCNGWTQQGTYQSCPVAEHHYWWGCVGSRAYPADVDGNADLVTAVNPVPALVDWSCPTPLQRLTSSKTTVQTAIDALTPSGNTYIAPGLLWAWRTISPNTPYADGASYGSRTRKFIVLMTDGFNTQSPNYPWHDASNVGDASCSDVTGANCLTKKTCDSVKSKGITIFTVAFQVADSTVKSILQNCASNSSNYYDSASAADLQTAFQSIGRSVTQVRILN